MHSFVDGIICTINYSKVHYNIIDLRQKLHSLAQESQGGKARYILSIVL